MKKDRREFLKLSGLAVCGILGNTLCDSAAVAREPSVHPNSLKLRGSRWAMVINPYKCKKGCTDCITACHLAHNVPDFGNPKDEVKWLWLDDYKHTFTSQQHQFIKEDYKHRPFPVLCNHCQNPPCVRVCPTKATFQRKDGIVLMDYHRCIGCRFCMAACPYGARSFNWFDPRKVIHKPNITFPSRTKGVVEKCNFCAERLAVGKHPLCQETCKHGAITFGDLQNPSSKVSKQLKENFTIRRKPEIGTGPQVYYIA